MAVLGADFWEEKMVVQIFMTIVEKYIPLLLLIQIFL